MARGGDRRAPFRRTRGGGPRRNNSRFRDFESDKYRNRDNDREGPRGGRRSGGFRRNDRDDRRGRRGGDRRDRDRDRSRRGGPRRGGRGGNDIEGRLDNYWKAHNKTARNDVEISLELDEYWKQGKHDAKKDDKTTNGDANTKTVDNAQKAADANKEKDVEL